MIPQQTSRGRLIVIDGNDGSGKATQANLLLDYLQRKNIQTKYFDFPRYDSFYGSLVGRFLRGEFGSIETVSPYLVSLPYALDRAELKEEMKEFLNRGGYIITNRYVSSNMAHQGAKLTDVKERDSFIAWIEELEYRVNQTPREDIVIYLYVPWKIGVTLTHQKGERAYLQGQKADIHEENHNHREQAETMYLNLAKRYPHWNTIDCTENGHLLTKEEIHAKLIAILQEKGIIE